MTQVSIEFLVLVALALPIYFLFFDKPVSRPWFLSLLGLACLMMFDWRAIGVVLFLGLHTWIFAGWIHANEPRAARRIYQLGIVIPVLALIATKWLLAAEQLSSIPLGLSFGIFLSIYYLTEVYFGRLTQFPAVNIVAGFAFFPVAAAGPIMNPQQLMYDLSAKIDDKWKREALWLSLVFIASGLFKKGIANAMNQVLVGHPMLNEIAPGRWAWIESIAFGAQIYADFSGYTDLAIGFGGLLGVSVPNNFNLPFLASSITEYWQRWHMTFNEWTRKHFFHVLVFGRLTARLSEISWIGRALYNIRVYWAAFATMLAVGLWHGFSANYLVWGLYMGSLLVFELIVSTAVPRGLPIPKPVKIVSTFLLITIGFGIFKQTNLSETWNFLTRLSDLSLQQKGALGGSYLIVALAGIVVPHSLDLLLRSQRHFFGRPIGAVAISIILIGCFHLFSSFGGAPFLYATF